MRVLRLTFSPKIHVGIASVSRRYRVGAAGPTRRDVGVSICGQKEAGQKEAKMMSVLGGVAC